MMVMAEEHCKLIIILARVYFSLILNKVIAFLGSHVIFDSLYTESTYIGTELLVRNVAEF